MKAESIYKVVLLLCLFTVAAGTRAPQPAAPVVAPPPPDPNAHRSLFIDTAGFGRDPFFPNSKRNQRAAPLPVIGGGDIPGSIVLKGISGTVDKRLAIINNYTLAVGEESEIRGGGQIYRVRLDEIRERSVMISVNGTEPKELKLRSGL